MNVAFYDKITGKIVLRSTGAPAVILGLLQENEEFYLNCPVEATHIISGEPVVILAPVPIPSATLILATLTAAVQTYLDTTARSKNYDSILSLCSYATSIDTIFKAEGQAGVEWRDACWRTSYNILAAVQAGTRTIPTPEEIIAEMPLMVWPV